MKPLRTRLQEARKRFGIPWEVLERDYLLSWVLAGIGQVGSLRDTLVFKGGSALKKCWFGDYRFSEDLDFSGMEGVPTGKAMEDAMQESCRAAARLIDEYAPVEIGCERYTEKDPHPGGQEAFSIRARLPWQREAHTRVMVEVSVDEKVLKPAPKRAIIHGYGEPLGAYKSRMDLSEFASFLREKCAARHVSFKGPADFFQETMLAYVEKTWDQWLGPLVPGLPTYGTVVGELRPQVDALLASP